MSKGASAGILTALADSVLRPVLAAELMMSSPLRVCSAPFPVTISGNVYTGVGKFGSISEVEETGETQAYKMKLSLYGIPVDLVGLALSEHYQGKQASVWIAFLDSGHVVIPSPLLLFSGRMDTMEISLGVEATVSVNVESRLADWERPRFSRYTDEDQKSRYATDKIFQYVSSMQEKEIKWGRS